MFQSYKFIDQKDAQDVPELVVDRIYRGRNDDGQMVDIYDIDGSGAERLIGAYCVERFEKLTNKIQFQTVGELLDILTNALANGTLNCDAQVHNEDCQFTELEFDEEGDIVLM